MLVFKLLFIVFTLSGQALEMGIGAGRSVYYGDLNSGYYFDKFIRNGDFTLDIFGRSVFNQHYGIRANFSYCKVKGNDANSQLEWQKMRNLSFFSDIFEFSIRGEYYFFDYNPGQMRKPVVPFVSAGLGVFHFNSKTTFEGNIIELRKLGTEGQGLVGYPDFYNNVAVSIPFGLGIIFKFNEQISVGAEIIWRYTTTDYLDDVSGNYVNQEVFRQNSRQLTALLADPTWEYLGQPFERATGSQRGGKDKNDFFTGYTINVSYAISDGRKISKSRLLKDYHKTNKY